MHLSVIVGQLFIESNPSGIDRYIDACIYWVKNKYLNLSICIYIWLSNKPSHLPSTIFRRGAFVN